MKLKSYVVITAALISLSAFATDKPIYLGPMSNIELERIDQVLVRCGADKRSDGKSKLIQENVRSAKYFLNMSYNEELTPSLPVFSAGDSTWFDPIKIEEMSYRERTLKMLSERLKQRPIKATEDQAAQLTSAIRLALPLITKIYFSRPIEQQTISKSTRQQINKIPSILAELNLVSKSDHGLNTGSVVNTSNGLDSRDCFDKIIDSSYNFTADDKLKHTLKEKEEIFSLRAKHSIAEAKDRLIGHSGDTLLWTGIYIGSQAHRYLVTHDLEAIRNLESSLWSFHDLHKVTGTKTLVARRMEFNPNSYQNPPHGWFRGSQGYENYIWRGHVSWDMYVGYLYALSESWDVIQDEKLRSALKEDMREIAYGFIENGFAISGYDTYLSSDPDGCFTDHRKCGLAEKIVKNLLHTFAVKAGNALRSLALLQLASRITEDKKIVDTYQYLIDVAWWRYGRDFGLARTEKIINRAEPIINILVDLFKGSKVDADENTFLDSVGCNLGHLMGYLLTRNETRPKIRSYYLDGFKNMVHAPVKHDGNSFWNILIGSQESKKSVTADIDSAIEGLYRFPLDKYFERTNSNNPDIPKYLGLTSGFFKSDEKGTWFSYEPLPIDIRPMHGFAWQNNAYRMDGVYEDAAPGVPFIAAYWLARYADFITEKD